MLGCSEEDNGGVRVFGRTMGDVRVFGEDNGGMLKGQKPVSDKNSHCADYLQGHSLQFSH